MGLEGDLKKLGELREQGDAISQEAGKVIELLREKIKAGETTGDRVRDFSIVYLGGTSNVEFEKPFRDLQQAIEGKEGELVLIDEKRSENDLLEPRYLHGMLPRRPSRQIVRHNLKLGVLTSGFDFNVDSTDVIIGTDKHAVEETNYHFHCYGWKLREGPIHISADLFPIPNIHSTLMSTSNRIEVYTGKDVEDYFRAGRNPALMRDYGIRLPTPATDSMDLSYVDALNLLGLEVPVDFLRMKNKVITESRARVCSTLEKLALQEKPNESELRTALREALELRLHQSSVDISTRPGVKVDISGYVLAQCDRLKIKLPT